MNFFYPNIIKNLFITFTFSTENRANRGPAVIPACQFEHQWKRLQKKLLDCLKYVKVNLHFHLGSYVNKQNFRIWGSKNPKIIIEKTLYPQFVTFWCGFWAGGIIVPYFFENEVGAAVSMNELHCQAMINEFLWPKLEDMDVEDVYFQKDSSKQRLQLASEIMQFNTSKLFLWSFKKL